MSDQVLNALHQHNIAGDCYAVSLSETTATNANVRIGVTIYPNNISKKVLIYRAVCNNNDTGEADITITSATGPDGNFSSTLTPVNLQLGSANTSLCTVKGSPAGSTAPTSATGTRLAIYRLTSSQLGFECFDNGTGIYIPANTSNVAVNFYVKVPTAGKTGLLTIEYIEF